MANAPQGRCILTACFTCPDRHSDVVPGDEAATANMLGPVLRARIVTYVTVIGEFELRVTHLPEAEVGCYEAQGGWVTYLHISAHCAVAPAHLTPAGLSALVNHIEAECAVALNQFFGFVQVDEVFLIPDTTSGVAPALPVR